MLTVGSCFSGIGGLELGLEWTGGFETRWQIENDKYASAVLKRHWPGVQRYEDIRGVSFPEPVDLICGGFPCQDVSLAGMRAGLEGKRSTLWGEMLRLVRDVRPRWVVVENVPGLLSSDDGRFFGTVLRDLAGAGYDAEWGVLSAAGVGAPHLRKRVFIVAYTIRKRSGMEEYRSGGQERESAGAPESALLPQGNGTARTKGVDTSDEDVAYATRPEVRSGHKEIRNGGWWATEPDVRRVAHGVPSRVDRLKCLGNAVVPQVSQKIGEMILRYEELKQCA